MKSCLLGAVCACIITLVSLSANAALVSRLGGQAVYDTDLDITWLADANAGAGSAFDDGFSSVDGQMTWANANAWAASLTVGGFTDWRLPTTAIPDASCTDDIAGSTPSADPIGYNCTGSELGHLYYNEFGATANTSVFATGDATELAKFTNVKEGRYWSGLEYAPDPTNAWDFRFGSGNGGLQAATIKVGEVNAWAVRSGDVSAVPIPAAVWLFGSGLLGLVGMVRSKKV